MCRAPFDAYVADVKTDKEPEPGDYVVCSQCAALLIVTKTMGVERLSREQLEEVNADQEFAAEVAYLQRVIRTASASVN